MDIPENIGTLSTSSGSSASTGPSTTSPMEEVTSTSWTDSKLVVHWGESPWRGDSCDRGSDACLGVGLLGRGLTVVDACKGVGLVGRTGVGVPLPVACAGVGLVGLILLGVALGSPVALASVSVSASADKSWLGRGTSRLDEAFSPPVRKQ